MSWIDTVIKVLWFTGAAASVIWLLTIRLLGKYIGWTITVEDVSFFVATICTGAMCVLSVFCLVLWLWYQNTTWLKRLLWCVSYVLLSAAYILYMLYV